MDGMTHTADVFYSENNLQDLNVIGLNLTKDDLAKTISIYKNSYYYIKENVLFSRGKHLTI